jgi:hypothetical protein
MGQIEMEYHKGTNVAKRRMPNETTQAVWTIGIVDGKWD